MSVTSGTHVKVSWRAQGTLQTPGGKMALHSQASGTCS